MGLILPSILPTIATPFVAGDYSAKGSMTWIVTVLQADSHYRIVKGVMTWWINCQGGTLGGVANNQLYIKVPGGKVLKSGGAFPCIVNIGASNPEYNIAGFKDFDSTHIALNRIGFANYTLGLFGCCFAIICEVT